jgi:hypothetical protein
MILGITLEEDETLCFQVAGIDGIVTVKASLANWNNVLDVVTLTAEGTVIDHVTCETRKMDDYDY